MTKEVVISIRGLQDGSQTDGQPIETITMGEHFYKNQKHYIMYEEVIEGESKKNKNRIKIAPSMVEVTKNGMVAVQMCFEENKKYLTQYHTPYGSLHMGIDTKSVKIEEQEDEIKIFIQYALEMNDAFMADCKIEILVKSKETQV